MPDLYDPDCNITVRQGTEHDGKPLSSLDTNEQIKANYQKSFEELFGSPAPEVRISDAGGFYVRAPVQRHYSTQDLIKVTRFNNELAKA